MSRERDAVELIWECLAKAKDDAGYSYKSCCLNIEQILTQMEDLIQEDLTLMESESRGASNCRVTPKTCPLIEEYKKSQEATNTSAFWAKLAADTKTNHETLEHQARINNLLNRSRAFEDSAEGDILSECEPYSPI